MMKTIFDQKLKVKPDRLKGKAAAVSVIEMPPYQTLIEIAEGTPLEETAYFEMFIQRGNSPAQAKGYVELFLGKNGRAENSSWQPRISANIDGQGNIILNSGYEDAAIAARLNIPEVEVEIVSRSPLWEDLVTRLYNVRGERFSYQPVFPEQEHPEFQTWNFARGRERAQLISEDVGSLDGQSWLDVGSLTGFQSRMLERCGAKVMGVEMHAPYVEIAQLLNQVQGTNVQYEKQKLRQWLAQNKRTFDGVLCLSIIHNIAQMGDPKGAKNALKSLSKLSPVMYFDIGQANEGEKVTGSGLDLREDNLRQFITGNSDYSRVEIIGRERSYCGRALLKLSR